jgi:putative PIN family toxin of toxin-antitoxin system
LGKKVKVVIDTNVIISAFGWHGFSADVVELADGGPILNHTSWAMLEELRRAVGYSRLHFPESLQAEIIETIFDISSLVEIGINLDVVSDDPDDNMIIECAVAAGARYIISGDNHLLSLKKYRGIEILKPADFILRHTE